ncbi:MAG: Holliday junction branch migration protein RuvA [bacterium]
MIAHLTGTLSYKSPEYIVLDVHGVGYGLFVTLYTFYELPDCGAQTTLFTYTHVREDALQLYGFLTEEERAVFQHLISVNKIGPKLARNILSRLSVTDLTSAILHADSCRINAIPGIGEKTAQRLIIELRDKIARQDTQVPVMPQGVPSADRDSLFTDAVSALINLGYPKNKAEKTVRSCLTQRSDDPWTLGDIIKHSLDLITR